MFPQTKVVTRESDNLALVLCGTSYVCAAGDEFFYSKNASDHSPLLEGKTAKKRKVRIGTFHREPGQVETGSGTIGKMASEREGRARCKSFKGAPFTACEWRFSTP